MILFIWKKFDNIVIFFFLYSSLYLLKEFKNTTYVIVSKNSVYSFLRLSISFVLNGKIIFWTKLIETDCYNLVNQLSTHLLLLVSSKFFHVTMTEIAQFWPRTIVFYSHDLIEKECVIVWCIKIRFDLQINY